MLVCPEFDGIDFRILHGGTERNGRKIRLFGRVSDAG